MKRLACLGVVSVLSIFTGCVQPVPAVNPPTVSGPVDVGAKVAAPATAVAPTTAGVAATSAAGEIVIDNGDPTFRSTGDWTPANGGSDFKDSTAWAVGDSIESAKAVWTPTIKTAGNYAVWEWHGEDPNDDHATNATFTVKFDGGSKPITLDLKKNTGKWNLLGTFKFAAGTAGNVTLTNKANGNVIADAIKFVPEK
jgi:hypothetical protein